MHPEDRVALALVLIALSWLVLLTVLLCVGAIVTVDGHQYVVRLGRP